ncbi:HsdR family type I site-specific deoxyribonuclease [Gilvimarinus agarilyticus]|uniref:type I restriction endonuclease subunit R n=1 Tax=Gilvimarinus sp. 2_MG-2023 TaxID=3062666 RepID=UPI001C082FE0|nr:HsdR family type I site-specific deoxyribonuclease [Gilvimarinus sp. 2_MG-2023]MBU2887704.1 HsdR family type I site-specific deoxyribonuclease [Gilvimarinus agarilyticus]MDO6572351.1 HsdR family type I site-specific deoxyribonuclease [Gilvimarinus sp. 2_MG-2023]
MDTTPQSTEQHASHIPALATLINLGWRFLPAAECSSLRGSPREVVMKPVLERVLRQRRFEFKGQRYPLSDQAVDQVIREVTSPSMAQGLMDANQSVYDKLTLGVTVTEFIDGKKATPTIHLIDWNELDKNEFHVTEEMEVLSTQATHTRRPDVVAFVNGIPLAVIEAKRAASGNPNKNMVDEGISQNLRNQKNDEIPALFAFAQLLFSISLTDGRYGTTHTPAKFWSKWVDEEFDDQTIQAIKNTPLTATAKNALFAGKPEKIRAYFEQLWSKPLQPTEQDRLLVGLLDRHRFIEFLQLFILFDRKLGKIAARYPQAFGIKALLARIAGIKPTGERQGGVLWHTTGSGKSFTMVYLCRALLLSDALKNCRILVVTDRVDLEKQLSKTFLTGGAFGSDIAGKKSGDELAKTRSGKQLAQRIGKGNERIIFTIINKFASAAKQPECYNPSENMIVIVDEGHRSQGGENHQRMRQALPNAAFIAFTGTPLLEKDKSETEQRFGKIIHAYTMKRAVDDGTITPLLYEDRKPLLDVNQKAVDAWFDKVTASLSDEQKDDLKRKYTNQGQVYSANDRIKLIAFDIGVHFSEYYKKAGLQLKGQLATDSKLSAIRYKQALDSLDMVTSAIVISAPDTREGHTDVDESNLPLVQDWWKKHVTGDPAAYEKTIIEDFGTDGPPDILIVVDKLLTGFDEPRNAVLYIDKQIKGHNLIQAIARVNRLHPQKRFGYLIDYRGILKDLDTAIKDYQNFEDQTQGGYAIEDIEGLYSNVNTEYKKLPALHDRLWEFFKHIDNKLDQEAYRQVLMPKYEPGPDDEELDIRQAVREDFYEAVTEFGMCLKTALSSQSFFADKAFSEEDIRLYKKDLKWFSDLRKTARMDAQETIDYSAYEGQIRDLIDRYVTGVDIAKGEEPVVIESIAENRPDYWSEDKARNETDKIKTRTKKTIEEKLGDDPYAQKVFSALLQEAIEKAEAMFDYKAQFRLFSDLEKQVEERDVPGLPVSAFDGNKHAQAYYGAFKLVLNDGFSELEKEQGEHLITEAFAIDKVVNRAVAENSLNPAGIEQEVRKNLLPRLFNLVGLDKAKEVLDEVVQILRNKGAK